MSILLFAYAFKLTGFAVSLTPEAHGKREAALQRLMESPIDPGKLHKDKIMFGTGK